jgi:hypothetical protein
MRIAPLLAPALAVLGTAAVLATTVLGAGAAHAAAGVPASLTAIDCRSSLDPTLRKVSVESVMGHLPGTRTLSARFSLIEQQAGEPPQSVAGGDLGRWLTPAIASLGRNPDDVWRLAKDVYDVDAPAEYHFEVDLRWIGVAGRTLAFHTLRTGDCTVRELRPDVLVRSVRVVALAGRPRHERYVATIANAGATASGPFSVQFTPGVGAASQSRSVPSLAPHQSHRVTFLGSLCDAADPPTVVADPSDAVDDDNRADNTLTVSCPAT